MSESASPQVVTIEETTQAHLSPGLSIAAGNFWEADHPDAAGAPTRGLTCGLWISEGEAGTKPRHVRVHRGASLEVQGRPVSVVSLSKEGGRGRVTLSVSPPAPPR